MVNKQKRWVGMVIVEFNSEDFLQAKDKIEDMNSCILCLINFNSAASSFVHYAC